MDLSGAPDSPSSRIVRQLRRLGVWRLLFTAAIVGLALVLALFSWSIPFARDWERSAYNLRVFFTAPAVDQDARIVEVVYTDDTLAALGKRSPLPRDVLAKALVNLDRLRPRAIGIDILIDQPQPEDDALVRAFRSLTTPTYLGYATAARNADQILGWQQDFMDGFARRIATPFVHKASIRLEADADNVARVWPAQPPELPPLLGPAMAGIDPVRAGYAGSIAYRLPRAKDRPVFATLPIDLLANDAVAPALRGQIAGRYVLVGGMISDTDLWDTPISRIDKQPVIGLDLHATMLAQLLDRQRLAVPPPWTLWAEGILFVAIGCATALLDLRTWQMGLVIAGQLAVIVGLPYVLQLNGVDTGTIPAAGWAVGWIVAFAAVGAAARGVGSDQRRYAQSAFGRYLPRDIAAAILRDPDRLKLEGEKRDIVALFTDLEGFTKLSHAISPEMVAFLLNRYLDRMCAIVLAHGGTIDKFVGDAVVAFWGAPIARPDDDDRAVAAAIAMYEAGERFRAEAPEGVPPIGRTRVGVHRGEAVVGNFGGEGRIAYTALGDAMNTAARLEGANKYLRTTALVSGSVAERYTGDLLRPLGRIAVSGRSTPIAIFEPAPLMTGDERRRFAALYERAGAGERIAADELDAFVASRSEDSALACFGERMKEVGPGGTYVLESK